MATLLIIAGAGAAYRVYRDHAEQQEQYYALDEGLTREGKSAVAFLPTEHGVPSHSLSTVTHCTGDYQQVFPRLAKRVDQILQANPWLKGFISPDPEDDGDLKLWYDNDASDADNNSNSRYCQCFEPGVVPLTQKTPFERYYKICKSQGNNIKVPPTDELIGRNVPLWRVSCVPDASAPHEKFILVVSMATLLGDNCTFYNLYNQLLQGGEIHSLNPVRKQEYLLEAQEQLGSEEFLYLQKLAESNESGSPLRVLRENFIHKKDKDKDKEEQEQHEPNNGLEEEQPPKNDDEEDEDDDLPQILVFRINNQWLNEQKTLYPNVQHNYMSCHIISWFFRYLHPDVGLLANSWRDVLPAIGPRDAGNYQSPVPLAHGDYQRPEQIQIAFAKGKRISFPHHVESTEPLPDNPEKLAVAVDWTQSADNNNNNTGNGGDGGSSTNSSTDASGLVDFEETYHFPLVDIDDLQVFPKNVSGLIVFRASPPSTTADEQQEQEQQLGVLCVIPKDKKLFQSIQQCGIMDARDVNNIKITSSLNSVLRNSERQKASISLNLDDLEE